MEQTQQPDAPPAQPQPDRGFFGWVRSLGIERSDGWVAGVCAGIARRTGADPTIVRGIFAVAAVLGFPALWLYAIAWALLPDAEGRIVARLRHGSAPGALGVVITAGLAVIAGWGGASVAGVVLAATRPESIGWDPMGTLLWLAVLGGIAALIIWGVRRPRRTSQAMDAGAPGTRGGTAAVVWTAIGVGALVLIVMQMTLPLIFGSYNGSGLGAVLAFVALCAVIAGAVWAMRAVVRRRRRIAFGASSAATLPAPIAASDAVHVEGAQIGAGDAADATVAETAEASDADFADWRRRQDDWRADRDDWRVQQQDADRAARDEIRAQRQAEARAFAAEVTRRREERRATRPRTSFAFVAAVLGVAIISGALAALVARGDDGWQSEVHRGTAALGGALFAVGLVCAIGMIVAGILRRRSGFLTGAAIVMLLFGGGATVVANGVIGVNAQRDVAVGVGTTEVAQAYGYLELNLRADGEAAGTATVERRGGYTEISVPPDVDADVHLAVADDTYVNVMTINDEGYYEEYDVLEPVNGVIEWTSTPIVEDAPTRTVDLTQIRGGQITIWVQVPSDDAVSDATDEEGAE